MNPAGLPFKCPECDGTQFHADYWEGVWQTVYVVVGENGEPEVADYMGGGGDYVDANSEDERIKCASCEWFATLGAFEMLPVGGLPAAFQTVREWARANVGEWNAYEATEDVLGQLAKLLGVELPPAEKVLEIHLSDEEIGEDDFVDVACAAVLKRIEGGYSALGDATEIKRVTPADVGNPEVRYVEIELTDGRTYAARRETSE